VTEGIDSQRTFGQDFEFLTMKERAVRLKSHNKASERDLMERELVNHVRFSNLTPDMEHDTLTVTPLFVKNPIMMFQSLQSVADEDVTQNLCLSEFDATSQKLVTKTP
jgi:hypothetical protein